MEDDDEFELSFVEGLNLRMGLSQLGANDVNPWAQAQFKARLIGVLDIYGRVSRPRPWGIESDQVRGVSRRIAGNLGIGRLILGDVLVSCFVSNRFKL